MSDVVFDIGASRTRIATVRGGALFEQCSLITPQNFDEAIQELVTHITPRMPTRVAGGVAGSVNAGVVSDARNLPDWNNKNIVDALSTALSAPVTVENDAMLAGLGEATYGAGKDANTVAYLTISTGVGGGRIVNGAIDHEASEKLRPGHIMVGDTDLESLLSGTAVKKRFGVDPRKLPADNLNKLAGELSRGLEIVIKEWTPDVIILGGPMILGESAIPLDKVRASAPIKKAALGDDSGLWGAVAVQSPSRAA